jgi:hypothetical protein
MAVKEILGAKRSSKPMLIIQGRVPHFSKELRSFVAFLNEEYPLKKDVRLQIFPDDEIESDSTKVPDDEDSRDEPYYGIYHDGKKTNGVKLMYLATGLFCPEYEAITLLLLAHEYKHALQDQTGKALNEAQADQFAFKVVLEYVRRQRGDPR